jgi:hypothetical protein
LARHLNACKADKPLSKRLKKGDGHGGNTYLTEEQKEENVKFRD